MKRLFALILFTCMIFSLASCMISDDPYDIKSELKEEGYAVDTIKDRDELEALEEALDYIDVYSDGIDRVLFAVREDKYDKPIIVFFCDEKKDAKKLEADLKDLQGDGDRLEFIEEEFEYYLKDTSLKGDCEIVRSGKVVAVGHKNTVKIIK